MMTTVTPHNVCEKLDDAARTIVDDTGSGTADPSAGLIDRQR